MPRQIEHGVILEEAASSGAWFPFARGSCLSREELVQEKNGRIRVHVGEDLSSDQALLKTVTVKVTGEAE